MLGGRRTGHAAVAVPQRVEGLDAALCVPVNQQEGNGPTDERRKTNLASDLKSMTSITYISMCILFIWSLMVASEATTG